MKLLIIGCGWLGQAIGKAALDNGYTVMGTRTNPQGVTQLLEDGISGISYKLGDSIHAILTGYQPSAVVIAIPPSRPAEYLNALQKTLAQIQIPKLKIIFISSTGYYPSRGNFSEASIFNNSPANSLVFEAESLVTQHIKNPCILRMGGLFNLTDRHPGQWFKGRTEVPDGYANMVHQSDAAGSVLFAIENDMEGAYNIVSPERTRKNSFYKEAFCDAGNQTIPTFIANDDSKWVDGSLWRSLGYTYRYDSALDAFSHKKPHLQ